MTRQEGGVAPGAKAHGEIHTASAVPYYTLVLVQQLLGNGFKSWIVGNLDEGQGQELGSGGWQNLSLRQFGDVSFKWT